jgi:hypothetical protein
MMLRTGFVEPFRIWDLVFRVSVGHIPYHTYKYLRSDVK